MLIDLLTAFTLRVRSLWLAPLLFVFLGGTAAGAALPKIVSDKQHDAAYAKGTGLITPPFEIA